MHLITHINITSAIFDRANTYHLALIEPSHSLLEFETELSSQKRGQALDPSAPGELLNNSLPSNLWAATAHFLATAEWCSENKNSHTTFGSKELRTGSGISKARAPCCMDRPHPNIQSARNFEGSLIVAFLLGQARRSQYRKFTFYGHFAQFFHWTILYFLVFLLAAEKVLGEHHMKTAWILVFNNW